MDKAIEHPPQVTERIRAVRLLAAAGVLLWAVAFAIVRVRGSWEILVGLAPLLALATARVSRQTVGLLTPHVRHVVLGLVSAAAAIGLTYGLYHALAPRFPALTHEMVALYGVLHAVHFPPIVSGLCILVVACCEEVIFRGPVLTIGVSRRRRLAVAAVAALVAALAHATLGSPLLCLTVFVAGFGWGALRVLSHSLVPPILCHVLWDLAVVVLWPVA